MCYEKYATNDHEDLSRTVFLEEESGWDSLAWKSLALRTKSVSPKTSPGAFCAHDRRVLRLSASRRWRTSETTLPAVTNEARYDALLAQSRHRWGFAEVTLTRGAACRYLEHPRRPFVLGRDPGPASQARDRGPRQCGLVHCPVTAGRSSGTAEASAQVAGILPSCVGVSLSIRCSPAWRRRQDAVVVFLMGAPPTR